MRCVCVCTVQLCGISEEVAILPDHYPCVASHCLSFFCLVFKEVPLPLSLTVTVYSNKGGLLGFT